MNLWTLCLILFVLWLLGFFGRVNIGGNGNLIHVLLVVILVIVIVQLAQGRRPFS